MDEDRYYNLGSHDKLFNQIDELTDALASRDAEIESLRQQLVTLKTELKSIGEAIDDPRTDLTMTMSEVIVDQKQQLSAAQAKIDELMLEYCQEEMTQEQIAEYEKHQRPAWRNFSLELKKEQK